MRGQMLGSLGRRLRIGMVGGGLDSIIGETHRIAMQTDGLYELVAGAFSVDDDIARATAASLLVEPDRTYFDFRAMAEREAARPDGIDIVAVATPPQLHAIVAATFLRAGIHVLCEKPLTRSLAEAHALAGEVASAGRVFVLAHCYSGFPMVRHARDLVASGALGTIRVVDAEFAGGAPGVAREPPSPDQRHWRFRADSMGTEAILGEVGSHAYHLVRYVTGTTPARISARMQTIASGREVYDNAYLAFDTPFGCTGRLWASYVAVGTQHGLALRVFGDEASLEWREEDAEFLRFRPLRGPETVLRTGQDHTSRIVAASARFRPGHPEGYPLAFANIYADTAAAVVAALRDQDPAPWTGHLPGVDDGVAGMAMIEAAARSNREDGTWQML